MSKTVIHHLAVSAILLPGLALQATYAGVGPIIPESPAHGLYGKVEVGAGINNDLKDSWDDGSLSGRKTEATDTAYRLAVGYPVTSYVSVEGAYRNLGKYSLSGMSDGTGYSWSGPGPISGTQEAQAWALSITGRWPISERWTLYGTFGWSFWESEEYYNESGFLSSSNESGSDATFSGGVEFDHGLKDRIVYTAGVGHDRVGDDNLDVISGFAGILYRLP